MRGSSAAPSGSRSGPGRAEVHRHTGAVAGRVLHSIGEQGPEGQTHRCDGFVGRHSQLPTLVAAHPAIPVEAARAGRLPALRCLWWNRCRGDLHLDGADPHLQGTRAGCRPGHSTACGSVAYGETLHGRGNRLDPARHGRTDALQRPFGWSGGTLLTCGGSRRTDCPSAVDGLSATATGHVQGAGNGSSGWVGSLVADPAPMVCHAAPTSTCEATSAAI